MRLLCVCVIIVRTALNSGKADEKCHFKENELYNHYYDITAMHVFIKQSCVTCRCHCDLAVVTKIHFIVILLLGCRRAFIRALRFEV